MALMQVDFFSETLGMWTAMNVILPERARGQIGMDQKTSGGKCPVLYLLHGMSDDHTIWLRRTSIERYAADYGIAVVMPTTHLGWYTDMAIGHSYWTYLVEELPAVCRQFFPGISQLREDTFAAGLSMGGFGALKCGLRAPERFAAVASLSGAVHMALRFRQPPQEDASFWSDIFGPLDAFEGSFNDLYAAAGELKASEKPLPKIYMWCGTEDFLYEQNCMMNDRLQALGYDITFEQSPGDHQWKYWDAKIQDVLAWLPIKR